MGAIIGGLATFLGGALTAIVAWIGSALTSAALMKFLTFGAKIAFMVALASAVVAYAAPLAQSLSIGALPAQALWIADQVQFAYCFSVIMAAFVFSWAVKFLRQLL